MLDAFVDAGFNAIDTADSYSRWVPGHQGGESETIIGNWLKTERQARQGRHRHQVRRGHGRRPQPEEDYVMRACEASLQAPADRPHRPLPDAFRRRDDAGRGDLAGLCAADRAGQGARGRRLQLVAGAAEGLAGRQQEARPAALRVLQPLYNLSDRKEFETEYAPIVPRGGLGVINYYSLAAGFLTGKYRSLDEAVKHPRPRRPAQALRSTRAASASSRRSTRWRRGTMRRRRKWRSPG